MSTYFAFIDESGNYRQARTRSFTKRFPYYVKACVVVPAHHWTRLRDHRKALINRIGISPLEELKWSHIWKLRRRDVEQKPTKILPKESFLNNITFEQADAYAKELIAALPAYEPTIICTVTPNCVFWHRVAPMNLERMHFQNLMQRIEMDLQARDVDGVAVLFADQLSDRGQESDIRSQYNELFYGGDLINQYSHIFDTITFSESQHCCGIQLADFIAGFIVGFLRGFPVSRDMVALRIVDRIRRGTDNRTMGYGIIDIPRRDASREHLQEKFAQVLPF